jgi:indole-3-glycerol phosphate synthase
MIEKIVVINSGMVGVLQTSNGAGPVVEAMLDSRLASKLKKALAKENIENIVVSTGEIEEISKLAAEPKVVIAINNRVLETSSPKIDQAAITNLVKYSNADVTGSDIKGLVTKIKQIIKYN